MQENKTGNKAIKEKRIIKESDGKSYEVTLAEVSRRRYFPREDVIRVLAQALRNVEEATKKNPSLYTGPISLDPYRDAATWALDQIESGYKITILERDEAIHKDAQ